MTLHTRSRRRGAVLGVASLAALAVTGIVQAGPAGAAAAAAGNPYSPAVGHSYRHGVLPTLGTQAKMNAYAKAHPSVTTATGPQTLSYGGGVDGIGVQSGHSKTYLIFYGSQWGASSTDANGNLQFTGDSAGAAGVAQQMFKGIGTNNELWSADLTQWCDGPGVATGATSCPASGANYIPYQSGGVLSGVWYDNSGASPSAASALQLGQEAVNAAAHFGNTTAASNRYAYYVILSPPGTNPDNYQGAYCAWHDWNGDVGASSPYGDIAFSNQPYNIDSGYGCGVGFVNYPGTTDGYTITLGHEWHEMMSDQNPAGGWTNHTGSSYNGQENSDECAWIAPGSTGGAANVSFGSYGTYAQQASWSNDTNNCAISHPIVNHGASSKYVIKNASGKCLEISNSSNSNGAAAQQWDCLGQAGMYWRIGDAGPGYYSIQSNSSNKCLEISNSSYSNGAAAQQWDCLGQSGALWRFSGANIINWSGKCLEISNSSSSNGAAAQQWDCVGQSGAQWSLVSMDPCGEATCVPVQAAYVSHYTGLGCTGTESYYTPYFNSDGIRRSWDGQGIVGTIVHTVTNRSARTSNGVCTDYWPNGNTLSGFVTIYR